MTKDELAEIRALLIAQEALEAERARCLMGRLQQMFAPIRKIEPEPVESERVEAELVETVSARPEPPHRDNPHPSLFDLMDEPPPPEPPRRRFGLRDDEPLELIEPAPPPPLPDNRWGGLTLQAPEDEGAFYHPDDLADDTDWSDQALFEATITNWAAQMPILNDGRPAPQSARALLMRLEAALRIEREALERRLALKAA